MAKHPEIFLENLTVALKERELLPMWGQLPPFPWKSLEAIVKEVFENEDLEVSQTSADWIEYNHFFEGLGENPITLSLALTPLHPPFFLAFSKDDIETLTVSLLDKKDAKKSFVNTDYLSGFFRFVVLKLLTKFNTTNSFEGLSVKMNNAGLKSEPGYCVNIQIKHPQQALHARAIFPESFHKVASSHFMDKPLEKEALYSIDPKLSLSLTCGHVTLSIGDWESLKVGDFLVLDSCSYNPSKKSGSLKLNLSNHNLLLMHLKHQQLKIIDYALYEEENPMDEQETHEDKPSEDDNHEDFEEIEEFEDDVSEDEEDGEEDLTFEENDTLNEKLLSAQDIPLDVTVEVAKIKMPLKQLLTLKPGNSLEISAKPEAFVSLTISGKPVAQGQLVQIGDVIGVKITKIS